jgi:4-hydroxybenzoate polyprenyltransferase
MRLRSDDTMDHTTVTPTFPLVAIVRALRVEQWVKNLLVFMPLLMAPEVVELPLYVDAFLAFVSFSLCASAVYLVNDLVDADADRRHATKRRRPIAAGELPIGLAWIVAAGALVVGLAVATLLPPLFAGVLLVYLVVTTCYTLRWKHVPLVDVLVLAALYTARVVAGGAAYVLASPWLLGFSLFFFLSLAFVKRYAELRALAGHEPSPKVRGYYAADLGLITINGTVSGYCAVVTGPLHQPRPGVGNLSRARAAVAGVPAAPLLDQPHVDARASRRASRGSGAVSDPRPHELGRRDPARPRAVGRAALARYRCGVRRDATARAAIAASPYARRSAGRPCRSAGAASSSGAA